MPRIGAFCGMQLTRQLAPAGLVFLGGRRTVKNRSQHHKWTFEITSRSPLRTPPSATPQREIQRSPLKLSVRHIVLSWVMCPTLLRGHRKFQRTNYEHDSNHRCFGLTFGWWWLLWSWALLVTAKSNSHSGARVLRQPDSRILDRCSGAFAPKIGFVHDYGSGLNRTGAVLDSINQSLVAVRNASLTPPTAF